MDMYTTGYISPADATRKQQAYSGPQTKNTILKKQQINSMGGSMGTVKPANPVAYKPSTGSPDVFINDPKPNNMYSIPEMGGSMGQANPEPGKMYTGDPVFKSPWGAETSKQYAPEQQNTQAQQNSQAMTPTNYMELAKQFAGLFDTSAQEQSAKNGFNTALQKLQGNWASRGLGASGAAAAAEGQAATDLATNLAQLQTQSMEKALPYAMQYAQQQQAADQFNKTFGLQQDQFNADQQQQTWKNQFDVQQFDWQKEQSRLELELQKQGLDAQTANQAAAQAIAQAQLQMQQQNAALQQALQEASLTGYYNGSPTMQYQNNAFAQAMDIVDRLGYIPDGLLSGLTPQQQALLQSYQQGGATNG
jgi:hypothetical protein